MAAALIDLVEQVEDDDSAALLAIRGEACFCRGFDDDVDPRLVETLAALAKPTLAIIGGDCIDEGLELALAADLRATYPGAGFAVTQLRRGFLPRFGGTQRLPRMIGAAHALRMLLAGEAIDGREAHRLGLVTYLARNRKSLATLCAELVRSVTTRGPVANRLAKEAVLKGYDMTLEQGIRLEEDLYALLQTTADRSEGIKAFLEKRKPLFKGS